MCMYLEVCTKTSRMCRCISEHTRLLNSVAFNCAASCSISAIWGKNGCILFLLCKFYCIDPLCFPCCYCVYSRCNRRRVSRRWQDPTDTSTPSRSSISVTVHNKTKTERMGGERGCLISWDHAACLYLYGCSPPTAEESEPKSFHINSPPCCLISASNFLCCIRHGQHVFSAPVAVIVVGRGKKARPCWLDCQSIFPVIVSLFYNRDTINKDRDCWEFGGNFSSGTENRIYFRKLCIKQREEGKCLGFHCGNDYGVGKMSGSNHNNNIFLSVLVNVKTNCALSFISLKQLLGQQADWRRRASDTNSPNSFLLPYHEKVLLAEQLPLLIRGQSGGSVCKEQVRHLLTEEVCLD